VGSLVILTYDDRPDPTIILDHAKNIMFNEISIAIGSNWATALQITNNSDSIVFDHCQLAGHQTGQCISIGDSSSNVTIKSSFIDGGSSYGRAHTGIYISNAQDITIENNQVSNLISVGIWVNGSGNQNINIKNNNVFNVLQTGLQIQGSQTANIFDNTIKGSQNGINFSYGSGPSKVFNNRISGITQCGIYLSQLENSLIANNFIQTEGINQVRGSGLGKSAGSGPATGHGLKSKWLTSTGRPWRIWLTDTYLLP
jgi:parallel beta-helix repeat protein